MFFKKVGGGVCILYMYRLTIEPRPPTQLLVLACFLAREIAVNNSNTLRRCFITIIATHRYNHCVYFRFDSQLTAPDQAIPSAVSLKVDSLQDLRSD